MLAVGLEAFGDLAGQLARRREDERTCAAARRRLTVGGEALQDRQRERGRLAGSRLRDAEQILAGEQARNGLHLDGCGGRVAFGLPAP